MTITREHLELAAKAVRKRYLQGRLVPLGSPPESNFLSYPLWAPDTDTADAAQLAEDCKLQIDFYGEWVDFRVDGFKYSVKFGPLADNKETWMQAVTLAAAEIGRAK